MPSFRQRLAEASRALPLGLFALCLLLASGSLALLYGFTSPADLQALRHTLFAQNEVPGFVLHVEAGRYRAFQAGLVSCFLVAAVATYYLLRQPAAYSLRAAWRDARGTLAGLLSAGRALSGPERGLSGALLLGLVAVRLYYALAYPLGTDEVATYDYFVRGGALASTSFYPFPNNHILFSLCCGLVSCFSDNAALILRLPAFLISLGGTVLLFLLLLQFTSFRIAFLTVGLFSFSPLALYYAVAGRGYFLLILLSVVQFFTTLRLLTAPRHAHLLWFSFGLTGVLGLYTVPTYAYVVAALMVVAGIGFAKQQHTGPLLSLALVLVLIIGGTLLLYSPVLAISGLRALVANAYIAPQTFSAFLSTYPAYLQAQVHELFGHQAVVEWAVLLLPAGAISLLPLLPPDRRRVGGAALVVLLLPLVFMLLQRVQVPARALVYLTLYFFLAAAIGLDYLLRRGQVPHGLGVLLCLVLVGAYGGYKVTRAYHGVVAMQQRELQLQRAYQWVHQQRPRRVYYRAPFHQLYFHHYAQVAHSPLYAFSHPAPAKMAFDLVVLEHPASAARLPLNGLTYRPAYADSWVTIYAPVVQRGPGVPSGRAAPAGNGRK